MLAKARPRPGQVRPAPIRFELWQIVGDNFVDFFFAHLNIAIHDGHGDTVGVTQAQGHRTDPARMKAINRRFLDSQFIHQVHHPVGKALHALPFPTREGFGHAVSGGVGRKDGEAFGGDLLDQWNVFARGGG